LIRPDEELHQRKAYLQTEEGGGTAEEREKKKRSKIREEVEGGGLNGPIGWGGSDRTTSVTKSGNRQNQTKDQAEGKKGGDRWSKEIRGGGVHDSDPEKAVANINVSRGGLKK